MNWKNKLDQEQIFQETERKELTEGDSINHNYPWLKNHYESIQHFVSNLPKYASFKSQYAIWIRHKQRIINETDELTNVARARNRLLLDRKINIKQRNELHASANKVAFRELIVQHLDELIPKNDFKPLKPITNKKVYNDTVIYIFGDEHYRGDMDNDVIKNIFDNIKLDIGLNKYEKVTLINVGDNIEGLLHKNSLQTNDGAIISAIKYANLVGNYINELSSFVKQIGVRYISSANHSQTRTLNTKRDELAKEDLGLVICEIINGLVKNNPRIEYTWDDQLSFMLASAPREHGYRVVKNIFVCHGHQEWCKSREKITNYLESNSKNADLIIIGHYHQFKCNQFGIDKYLITCPAVKSFISQYEINAGYKLNPSILKLEDIFNNIEITQIKLEGK